MYLTRFRVNTARPGARRLLSSPQSLHAAVMVSFPAFLPTSEQAPRILWRLDRNARAEAFLYLVSPAEPDLTHLVEQAGWPVAASAPDTPGWETRGYAPLLERLAEGSSWAFRLTANPVHHIRRKEGEPTKRTAHVTPRHQKRWLLDRQERCGFRVLETPPRPDQLSDPEYTRHDLLVRDQRTLSFTKSDEGTTRSPKVTLLTVTFDGHLQVTDPQALRHTLVTGLGRGKAYGCGLMTLAAPVNAAPRG
ncbi:type I-E CRISPR-associated protein Cas6/Cse3/CasE [Streptomyces lydicus]|uniref:type I-E CRISPR-associated protein Cas6/Cse3/CasE n=1 Tax=Streptomyces lydicus TaxID=47763 RepID=UPI0036E06049